MPALGHGVAIAGAREVEEQFLLQACVLRCQKACRAHGHQTLLLRCASMCCSIFGGASRLWEATTASGAIITGRLPPPAGGRGEGGAVAALRNNNAASRGAALRICYTCLVVVRVAIRESVCV